MSETPLANDDTARTETGEIKDLTPKVEPKVEPKTEAKTETITSTEKKEEPKTESKVEEKKSLLNEKDKSPAGAPEKYEAFKVPDGFQLDETVATEAGTLFKGNPSG